MSGLWDQKDVPHKGWACTDVDDLEKERQICQMCRSQEIRYVHFMEHPSYPTTLEVGCECAAKMENNYSAATSREARMKSVAGRKSRWLKRKWRISQSGNPFINVNGFNIVVYSRDGKLWGARLIHEVSQKKAFSQKPFKTEEEAKLAAFGQLIIMEVNLGIL